MLEKAEIPKELLKADPNYIKKLQNFILDDISNNLKLDLVSSDIDAITNTKRNEEKIIHGISFLTLFLPRRVVFIPATQKL